MAPDLRVPPELHRSVFPAMGTSVLVLADDPSAGFAVKGLVERWERTLSRFRPESELSHLNRSAGLFSASELLFSVVSRARAAAVATGGLFDPCLGARLMALGYDRPFDALPSPRPSTRVVATPGRRWTDLRLDPTGRTIERPAGTLVDLGGIAKGMAVDAAAGALRADGSQRGLVCAGGDIAVWGAPIGATGWTVAVEGLAGTVDLRRGALATSSVLTRRWRDGRAERHHLVDPRTGRPATGGVASVTVAAARCEQAEVAAKSALILGLTAGPAFLARVGLSAVVVPAAGEPVVVGSWPADTTLAA